MGQAFSLMDAIFLLGGLYILYVAYQMKFKGEIREGVLIPREAIVKKCKDKDAYIKEVFPKTALYGSLVTLWGIISLLDDKYQFLHKGYLVFVALFLILTIWFAIATKKAYEKYWPQPKKPVKSNKK